MNKLQASHTELVEALEAAENHLEYCGYGDNWERECAMAQKLPEKIKKALNNAKALKEPTS